MNDRKLCRRDLGWSLRCLGTVRRRGHQPWPSPSPSPLPPGAREAWRQGGTDVTTFDYDFNGNLTTKTDGLNTPTPTTTALAYDPLDQMVTASKSWEQPQSYQYDDQGRRISKSVGGKVTNYVYNGQDIIAEYTGTWNQAAASYTHGSGTDQPLIRAMATTAQYYHQDGLGSVTAVTDQAGATVGTARNDAWGNKLSGNGGIPQFGYTGREPDETGLVFYRGRYYDPTIGRFTQRDPIGMAGGMNLYAYVGNNPTNFNDPMGTLPHEIGTLNFETANILPYNSTTPGLDSANQSLAAGNVFGNDISGFPMVADASGRIGSSESPRPPDFTSFPEQLADAAARGQLATGLLTTLPGTLGALAQEVLGGVRALTGALFGRGATEVGAEAAASADFFVTPLGTAVRTVTPGGRNILPEVAMRAESRGFNLGTLDATLNNSATFRFADTAKGTLRFFDPTNKTLGGEGFNVITNRAGDIVTGFASNAKFIGNPRYVPLP